MEDLFAFVEVYKELIGAVTFIVSILGFILINRMQVYMHRSSRPLGKKMARVYKWDSYKFLITAMFGLAGTIDAPHWFWHLIYFIRPFILIFLVLALVDLFKDFLKISKE